MKKENLNTVSKAGDVYQELNEIKKMQKSVDSYWTMWSNTCADFFTVICC